MKYQISFTRKAVLSGWQVWILPRAHKEEEHVTSGARVLGGNFYVCLNLE